MDIAPHLPPPSVVTLTTHEAFIGQVRNLAAARLNTESARAKLLAAKVVYGAGNRFRRGVCYFGGWTHEEHQDFVEISAFGEESLLQLVGTTLHELAHVLAGHKAGHGSGWKRSARALGLARAIGSGQHYSIDDFAASFLAEVAELTPPNDGRPSTGSDTSQRIVAPCPAGIGLRRGKSRGPGSGSRLRKWTCNCNPPVRVRVARDDFRATCLICGARFLRQVGNHHQEARPSTTPPSGTTSERTKA